AILFRNIRTLHRADFGRADAAEAARAKLVRGFTGTRGRPAERRGVQRDAGSELGARFGAQLAARNLGRFTGVVGSALVLVTTGAARAFAFPSSAGCCRPARRSFGGQR